MSHLHSDCFNFSESSETIIEGIAFAEFHVEEGPIIVLEYPDPSCSYALSHLHRHFSELNKLLIPRTEFCGHFITVDMENYILAGFPVEMKDEAYFRQKVEFNLFFLVKESNFRVFSRSIEESVKKLAYFLVELEYRTHSIYNEEAYGSLKKLCQRIFEDFRSSFECSILENGRTFTLRLFPNETILEDFGPSFEPVMCGRKIHDLLCPSFVKSNDNLVRYYAMRDLSFFKVISEIDGTKSIFALGILTELPKKTLYTIISALFCNKTIVLTDLLLFSNVYCLNPEKAQEFLSDPIKIGKLFRAVAKTSDTGGNGDPAKNSEASSSRSTPPSSSALEDDSPRSHPSFVTMSNRNSGKSQDSASEINESKMGSFQNNCINQDFQISSFSDSFSGLEVSETENIQRASLFICEEDRVSYGGESPSKEEILKKLPLKGLEAQNKRDSENIEAIMLLLSFFNGKDDLGTILSFPKALALLNKISIVRFIHFLNSREILQKLYYFPVPPLTQMAASPSRSNNELFGGSSEAIAKNKVMFSLSLSDFQEGKPIEEFAVKRGYEMETVISFLQKNNFLLIPRFYN